MTDQAQRVAILGFGFSGLMLLANLVRKAEAALTVYIIDPHLNARGVAYSTPYAEHLLNVRAANMSAWADDAAHFQTWLATHHPTYAPTDFVPRQIFGDYLESIFMGVQTEAATKKIYLKLLPTEAVALRQDHASIAVLTERGDAIAVDQVVLATGNEFKPVKPVVDAPVLQYPWQAGAIAESAKQAGPVILMGTGLTAVDIVLALRREGFAGEIIMYSRNGLLPQPHRDYGVAEAIPAKDLGPLQTLAQWVRWVRQATHHATDWRSVVDGLRPFTHAAWQTLPVGDQQTFFRRLASFWNVHRHRMAPQIAAQMQQEIEAGTVRVLTRRMLKQAAVAPTLIINCTGPELDVRKSRAPLLQHVVAQGMVEPHANGVGIAVDARQSAWGALHPHLYAMGALLTGQLLESTAVPELRVQAAAIAEDLCKSR